MVVKVNEIRNIRSISDTLKKPALPEHYNIREFTPSPKSNVLRSLVVRALLQNRRDVGSIPAGGPKLHFSQRSRFGLNNRMFLHSFS